MSTRHAGTAMSCRPPLALSICMLACGSLTADASDATPPGLRILAYEPLTLAASVLESQAPLKPGAVQPSTTLAFDAYGRRFDLELSPNPRIDRILTRDGVAFRGVVGSEPRSWVRLTRTGAGLQGMIWDGRELYVIAPGAESAAAIVPPLEFPDGGIIFRLSDTIVTDPRSTCVVASASTGGSQPGDAAFADLLSELGTMTDAARASGTALAIELSVLGDSLLSQYAGSAEHARDEILVRLNNVDGIFASQLGVQFSITSLDVYGTSDDPFSTTTAPASLLRELAQRRRTQPELRNSGLTHLFTARDLDGDTVGVAYLDALCEPELGAAISELRGRTAAYESLITAHEIGHNFGAPHDGEKGPCLTTPQSFLMAPRINGSDTFSSCSVDEIGVRIAIAPCIGPVPSVDLAAATATAVQRLLVGRESTLVFTVVNQGATTALAARAAATASGPGLELLRASTSEGSCLSNPPQMICDLGDLPADAAVQLEVGVAGSSAGTGTVTVAIDSSSADAQTANDVAVSRVSVEIGADLDVSLAAPASVDVERDFEIAVDVQNRTDVTATRPRVVTSIPSQLNVVSAYLPGGRCTIAASSVACEQDTLDGRRGLAAELVLRASAPNSYDVRSVASSDLLDPEPVNNEAVVRVTVSGGTPATAATTVSGGGGLLTLPLILLLVAVSVARLVLRHQLPASSTASSHLPRDGTSSAPE